MGREEGATARERFDIAPHYLARKEGRGSTEKGDREGESNVETRDWREEKEGMRNEFEQGFGRETEGIEA